MDITLKRVYHTKTGKLRAMVNYAGRNFTLKIDVLKNKKQRVSFISMPTYLTSFGVQEISIADTPHVTLRLLYPQGEELRVLKLGERSRI